MQNFLDDIFLHDDHTWISLTSHSGTIAAILRVIGHQSFRLVTGGVLPVLVRGEFLPSSSSSSSSCIEDGATSITMTMTSMVESSYYTTSTWCHNGPPVTSLASDEQGCVCQSTTVLPLPSLSTTTTTSLVETARETL